MQYLNEENTVNIAAQAKDNSLSSFSAAATDTNTASDVQKAKTAGCPDSGQRRRAGKEMQLKVQKIS